MRALISILTTSLALGASGCGDDAKRPLNEPCDSSSQCESGLCLASTCLDPAGDEDLDSIVNGLEAQFATDPFDEDSDGDGKLDRDEIGATDAPSDLDGDGKLDAIESSTADVDNDCIPDESDANDAFSDVASAEFPEACGTGEPVDPPTPPVAGASCSGTWTSIDGTCAKPAADMLRCFDGQGDCSLDFNETEGAIVFDNGARVEITELADGRTLADYINASGASCGIITNTETSDDFEMVTNGQTFIGTTDDTSNVTTLTCPSGVDVMLNEADNDAMLGCFGNDQCLSPGGSGECPTGTTCDVGTPGCCEVAPGVGLCLQPALCDVASSQD